ncbi:hypothetical protein [Amycolatopsis kentuckyensis]|uniref:hypothetical protein n=1 Tax=Amycolatopsis kentuckyensis TaxID=218823 RepID=UPI0035634AEB
MDEDYARKLRAWLSAEPEATPRGAEEEREWLREVPAPQADPDRWTVRGRLPREPAAELEELEEEWVCPVTALPVPRASEENGCRMSGADERRSRNRRLPGGRLGASEADERARRLSADQSGASETAERSRRLPGQPAADQLGANETAERSQTRRLPASPPGMSEAEARSRWNHPSNWHRRRRAEGQRPDQPGSH